MTVCINLLYYYLFLDATAGLYKNYSSNPPILVDDFSCDGSENGLKDCEYTEVGFDSTCQEYLGEATVSCIRKHNVDHKTYLFIYLHMICACMCIIQVCETKNNAAMP